MRRGRCATALACAALLATAACGIEPAAEGGTGDAPPATPAVAQLAVKQPERALPASKRIVGRYRLRLSRVPNAALGKDLAELKRKGTADQVVRVEYTFTDTEFILDTFGAVGRKRERFRYEILSENGDELMLRKHGETGKGPSDVKATVTSDALYIDAAGADRVQLERIE